MNILPNDRKLTASIIFVNLSTLFTDYCKDNCENNVLYYKRNNDVITISMDKEDIMDIVVSDENVRIDRLAQREDLYLSSRKFIQTLLN